MANPLYQMLNDGAQSALPAHPQNRLGLAIQAMRNPAAFAKQAFPDIPDAIQNDPNQILGYLQQTRGISNAQIQQILGMMR